jgi:NADP-dependent aldehyde dehydrogenase
MIQENIIGFTKSAIGDSYLQCRAAVSGDILPGKFSIATIDEINKACELASTAFTKFSKSNGKDRASFLRKIAHNILELGDRLVARAMMETGLPEGRIKGERGRTMGQLKMFADLIEEGSYVDAKIDSAQPKRGPISKPDIRRMKVPVGPVLVFTASNFPLAFSTAGGDTASALASGCPVIVKAHESHLGTNSLVAEAIIKAARSCNMPEGVFSSLNGSGPGQGGMLIENNHIQSIAFTGSRRAGMSIYKKARERQNPIPVFAEMGSINPVFILPNVLNNGVESLASTLVSSITLGVGQFCTNPGLIVFQKSEHSEKLKSEMSLAMDKINLPSMLNSGIASSFLKCSNDSKNKQVVEIVFDGESKENHSTSGLIMSISASDFIADPSFQDEIFGPATLLVECDNFDEMIEVADHMEGQLTSSIFTDGDSLNVLVDKLIKFSGRVIFNMVPTGVEVCHSMQHGGPFPASTDPRFTSVGTAAIERFIRPVSYQNFPESSLPQELLDSNPLGIWRNLDGKLTKDSL